MCPIYGAGGVDFTQQGPPFEIETAFIAPDDSTPWNFWWSLVPINTQGVSANWYPGLQNIPGEGRQFMNQISTDPNHLAPNPKFNVQFDPPIPQSILTHEPVHMLIQFIDTSHLRVGFKGEESEPWYFSKVFDTTHTFGTIKSVVAPCPVSFQGVPGQTGWKMGNYPEYYKFLIDYIRFRYGLTQSGPTNNLLLTY